MKKIVFLSCLVGVCIAQSTEMPDRSKWTPFQCREGILGPNDDRMKDVLKCEPGCHFFCHAKALGILNANGLPSEDTYDEWVDATMPAKHAEFSKVWFRNCFRRYATKIDLNDKECVMADAFADCTWTVQSHLDCPKTKTASLASFESYEDGLWRKK